MRSHDLSAQMTMKCNHTCVRILLSPSGHPPFSRVPTEKNTYGNFNRSARHEGMSDSIWEDNVACADLDIFRTDDHQNKIVDACCMTSVVVVEKHSTSFIFSIFVAGHVMMYLKRNTKQLTPKVSKLLKATALPQEQVSGCRVAVCGNNCSAHYTLSTVKLAIRTQGLLLLTGGNSALHTLPRTRVFLTCTHLPRSVGYNWPAREERVERMHVKTQRNKNTETKMSRGYRSNHEMRHDTTDRRAGGLCDSMYRMCFQEQFRPSSGAGGTSFHADAPKK